MTSFALLDLVIFLSSSGKTAVPERNSSCPQRSCMALPVGGEGEEGAEPRKVSGQRDLSFTSSLQLLLCCILHFMFLHFMRNVSETGNTTSYFSSRTGAISDYFNKPKI